MESGIEHIRAIIGDEATSGLDDAIISDSLWQFYFDIDQSIAWLLGSYPSYYHTILTPWFSLQRKKTGELLQRNAEVGHRIFSLCYCSFAFATFFMISPVLNPAGGPASAEKEMNHSKVHIVVILLCFCAS